MTAVSVSQQEGEIVLTKSGDPAIVYPVKGGKVDVPDEELADFLTSVSGSVIGDPVKPKAADA